MTDHTEDYASTLDEHWPAAASHMRKLSAENKRMREALTHIMSLHDHDSRTYRIAEKGMAK